MERTPGRGSRSSEIKFTMRAWISAAVDPLARRLRARDTAARGNENDEGHARGIRLAAARFYAQHPESAALRTLAAEELPPRCDTPHPAADDAAHAEAGDAC